MSAQLITTRVVQTTTIASGPPINALGFQGWYINPESSLEVISCETGSSLFTTSTYAVCCAIGRSCSSLWTTCAGTNPVGFSTASCGSGLFCQTMSIFDQFPIDGASFREQIICGGDNWAAASIYRTVNLPLTTTVLSTITESSSPASSTAPSTANTAEPGSSSPSVSSPTASAGTSATPPAGSSPSRAWIAGAVVGPIVAIAIIGVLLWLLFRKRKKNLANSPGHENPYQTHEVQGWSSPAANTSAYGMPDNHGAQKTIYEAHADYTSIPQELPTAEPRRGT
ncbi:hypothetical protein OPT61_g2280 [Boeremia exigua]|uniref:Uncharacterized protein n=1 Tax=Boeremia exigua TaxID=749465 RepID=A0ACC2IM23_9PLEO|nr:hypothetical protein OPT61_g2280 [Boeremia exigua]